MGWQLLMVDRARVGDLGVHADRMLVGYVLVLEMLCDEKVQMCCGGVHDTVEGPGSCLTAGLLTCRVVRTDLWAGPG